MWLKGVLHVHTTNSDGALSPQEALKVYREAGYDFICFGDHDKITMLDDPAGKMIVIPGAEYDAKPPEGGPAGFHLLAVGARKPPAGGDKWKRDPYGLAEELANCCDYLVLAHPYWSALTTELIAPMSSLAALEVYNHGCEVEDMLGQAMYVWDQLLARGRRLDGVAVDDAHWRCGDDFRGGWIMVKAAKRTPGAIIEAIKAGLFYASSGPDIEDIDLQWPRKMSVRCSPARSILFRCNRSLGTGNHHTHDQPLTQASHDIPVLAVFARVEVTDAQGKKAWSNPVYF